MSPCKSGLYQRCISKCQRVPTVVLLLKKHEDSGHSEPAAGAVISKSNKQSRGFFHPPISEHISSKSAPIIKRLEGTREEASVDRSNSWSTRFAGDEGAVCFCSSLFSTRTSEGDGSPFFSLLGRKIKNVLLKPHHAVSLEGSSAAKDTNRNCDLRVRGCLRCRMLEICQNESSVFQVGAADLKLSRGHLYFDLTLWAIFSLLFCFFHHSC